MSKEFFQGSVLEKNEKGEKARVECLMVMEPLADPNTKVARKATPEEVKEYESQAKQKAAPKARKRKGAAE